MMFGSRRPWSVRAIPRPAAATLAAASLAVAALAACGSPGPAGTAEAPAAGPAGPASQQPGAQRGSFSAPATVNNPRFPLVPGTQFVYQGKIVEGGESKPHSVVFTVTDLTKMVGGVRTVVTWDRDFLEGRLQEQEVALFAQDDEGSVWNFGEYPEEYENGKLMGAPSTWIRGAAGAYGGIHMLARPVTGLQYTEGRVPAIGFYDISKVTSTVQATCAKSGCYQRVLVVDEWNPGDAASGHQIKYYTPGVGLVRVGAQGGESQEFLTLTGVRHLGRPAMAQVRAAVLVMDRRAYQLTKVYRASQPAVPSR